MPVALDGTTGFLEHAGRLVSSYPCSMLAYGTRKADSTDQAWIAQSESSTDRRIMGYHAPFSDNKKVFVRALGNGTEGIRFDPPHASATELRPLVVIFNSPTSIAVAFGSNTIQQVPDGKADELAFHNVCTVGATRINGAAASFFANGDLAEAHWFSGALTSGNITALLAGTSKPEELANWVDGWTLKNYEASGNYLSISGTRTMVAQGGVTASALAHPVARSSPAAATIAWTEGADVIAATVNVAISGVAIAAAWTEGADVISITGTAAGVVIGTITTPPMVNDNDDLLANETGVIANVYNATTGALVVRKTGLTSSALGVVVISDGLIVAGTSYSYEIVLAANGRRLPVALAA